MYTQQIKGFLPSSSDELQPLTHELQPLTQLWEHNDNEHGTQNPTGWHETMWKTGVDRVERLTFERQDTKCSWMHRASLPFLPYLPLECQFPHQMRWWQPNPSLFGPGWTYLPTQRKCPQGCQWLGLMLLWCHLVVHVSKAHRLYDMVLFIMAE